MHYQRTCITDIHALPTSMYHRHPCIRFSENMWGPFSCRLAGVTCTAPADTPDVFHQSSKRMIVCSCITLSIWNLWSKFPSHWPIPRHTQALLFRKRMVCMRRLALEDEAVHAKLMSQSDLQGIVTRAWRCARDGDVLVVWSWCVPCLSWLVIHHFLINYWYLN